MEPVLVVKGGRLGGPAAAAGLDSPELDMFGCCWAGCGGFRGGRMREVEWGSRERSGGKDI